MINYTNLIKTISELGDVIYTIQPRSGQNTVVVGGTGNTWIGLFQENMVELYDTKTGELKHQIVNNDMKGLSFGVDGIGTGKFLEVYFFLKLRCVIRRGNMDAFACFVIITLITYILVENHI
jgi:hypothetical protein